MNVACTILEAAHEPVDINDAQTVGRTSGTGQSRATSPANPADSFFLDYYHDDKRQLLDPMTWIENSVVPFPKRPTVQRPAPTTLDQAKVDQAKELWRESKNYAGEGSRRFWEFAWALKLAGMNLDQIEAMLKEEYVHGRSPPERKGQIPGIMKTLRQSAKAA